MSDPNDKTLPSRTPEWWVYGTALAPPVIQVEERRTGALGFITAYTEAEWRQAFHAPSAPYPWTDPERVKVSQP
jgi:hypothetical protein